jgi:group I intron endonuclease
MMNKISGIYGIRSRVHPERVYIGSSVNIRGRWAGHISSLEMGMHHNKKLQRHYNKYGKEDLIFEAIIKCNKEELLKAEQLFIDLHKPYFNVCPIAGNQLGVRRTAETRRKISKAKSYTSEETRKRMSYGQKHKQPISMEAREKMSRLQTGRRHSMETKERMSQAQKGNQHWLGKRHSAEGLKNLSDKSGRAKLIINLETGIFYVSIKAAAASANKPGIWLSDKLTGHTKNNTMFRYA